MMIFTYLKVGVAVILLGVAGYFVWSYQHMKSKIAGLEEKVAGLELRAEIIEKAQQATDEFMKKKSTVQSRAGKERANVDKVVESGDDPAMRQLFINNGLLKPPQANSPASGGPGRPGNISPRPPRLQPLN